jgi:hypothetical protein
MESYSQWYSFLFKRGLYEYFGRKKKDRKELQKNSRPPYEGPKKYLPQIYSNEKKVLKDELDSS